MMASAMSPASAANAARAMASGRMACCVAATSSDRLMMSVPPSVPGNVCASATAAARNAAMLAPGRTRTAASVP